MKSIRMIKIPIIYGEKPISLVRLKGYFSTINHKPYLETQFRLGIDNQERKFHTCSNPHHDKLTLNRFEVSPPLNKENKSNLDLDSSVDTNEGFRAVCHRQEEFLTKKLEDEMKRADLLTNQEWDGLKNLVFKMIGPINEKNIDAVIMNKCAEIKSLPLGKAYFRYLKLTKKDINRATYGNYLRLFFFCKDYCTNNDFNEITVVYRELLEVFPVLDSHTAEKLVCALSLTEYWKEYEKLFKMIKQFYRPSLYIYEIVIQTAFEHQEFELGWKLMEEVQYYGLTVSDEVFLHWFEIVKSRKLHEDLFRVLNFFNYFNMKPSDDVCEGIRKAFEMCNEKGKVSFTQISRNGKCRNCHSMLDQCYVSLQDYEELKKAFLNPVVIGRDIFQKTKPEEFSEFLNFLKKSSPFSVVLDGLNIALFGPNKSANHCTFRLKSVVKHFVSLNKKVLVLGRKHMATWHTRDMEYVNNNALLFLTDNLSQDDPFMLYAALYNGFGTCFVSRDMMRGHKFLLADPKLQLTFQKWQSQHQYFIVTIERNGNVIFKQPVSFLQTIQQNSKGDWHIPYVIKGEELTNRDKVDHLHKYWMCLQTKPPVFAPRSRQHEPSIKQHKTWEADRHVKKSTGSIRIKELLKDDS